MKILTITIVASLSFLSNSSMANDASISYFERYEITMKAVETVCPNCEAALSSILEAMNRQCGFPLTEENVKVVANSHPVYAFSMAANSMLSDNDVKQSFNKALVDNVNCWDANVWIESTKEAMSNSESLQSILTDS